ncbi:MAG: MiaB/RimO family radical SAM methylthiotransferase [Rickettsiales bacterium]|jgi:threonylcarbamoyladenosine tRNA methylthiotransferase MtaB|nr:MiaB/RimO family radical SAM methylthiotransferase [Rickettsiales bacterium]
MQAENIKILSFGCRLNSLESEKIRAMLAPVLECAIVVNTCAVTAEAERQSGQAVRKLARENPNAPIFVTGCAATRNPGMFAEIPNTIVVDNRDKMNPDAYSRALGRAPCHKTAPEIHRFKNRDAGLSKQFIQIQNGCNHDCSYCVTRLLRGRQSSFEYGAILADARTAVAGGYREIVLTGVDIASWRQQGPGSDFLYLSDLCRMLLHDVPEIQRLRLSSLDPASPEIPKIIELMKTDSRMLPHMHLSMQSGCDPILAAMRRRHSADIVRGFVRPNPDISFSWDIICGFPGETEALFDETAALACELRPIKIHAFPFSPRPGTPAASMPNQMDRAVSKHRVKVITDIADENKREFMKAQLGKTVQVLVEENNTARTADDIGVCIDGALIPARTICDLQLKDISDLHFTA